MNIYSKGQAPDESAPVDDRNGLLPPGTPAPSFSLPDSQGQTHSSEMYRGRPVILAFYPEDGSPVCTDQLALYDAALPIFNEYQAQVLGISVDSPAAHRTFAEQNHFGFPLLSDFEPEGEVARQYGAYNEERRTCERALFVLNSQGIIRWNYLARRNENPGAHGILQALDRLKAEQKARRP